MAAKKKKRGRPRKTRVHVIDDQPGGAAATVIAPRNTHIGGAELVPDIERARKDGGVETEYRYWVGLLPDCPVEGIDLAGINFPKLNADLIPEPGSSGPRARKVHRLVAGSIVFLTESKIRLMRERLPRTVIRYTQDPALAQKRDPGEEPGTDGKLSVTAYRGAKGHVLTIPTEADISAGRRVRRYVPGPWDVPAARFMYCVLCKDQVNGSRDDGCPPTIEDVGLEWPGELT